MEIYRNINGVMVGFELTPNELYQAYAEQENIYDAQDIENKVVEMTDEEIVAAYGVTRQVWEELVPAMAYEKRRLMDKYGMDWETACDDAIAAIVGEYLEEHEPTEEE